MQFIINATNLKTGGALQVAHSILTEWSNMKLNHKFHLLLSPQLQLHMKGAQLDENFVQYPMPNNPNEGIKHFFAAKKLIKTIETKEKIDATFTLFGPGLLSSQSPQLIGFANGYYLFEESIYLKELLKKSVFFSIKYQLTRGIVFHRLKKEGDYYWVETAIAQKKLSQVLSIDLQKIAVIGNCASQDIPIAANQGTEQEPFTLVYPSSYYPHKNFEILPEVIASLEKKNIIVRFRFCLDPIIFQNIFKDTNPKYVENLGPLSAGQLPLMYENANALLMPSFLETFSANFPEAMKASLPILCSELDFARTICGDAALYFNPKDPKDIADRINQLAENKALQSELILKGKLRLQQMETAKSRANKLLTYLESIAKNNKQEICAG